jgi:hypothetical protein
MVKKKEYNKNKEKLIGDNQKIESIVRMVGCILCSCHKITLFPSIFFIFPQVPINCGGVAHSSET